MTAVDPIRAMIGYLAGAPGIEVVNGRVYGVELAENVQEKMPTAAIVVSPAGIGGGRIGRGDVMRVRDTRLDVRSYGATPAEAGQLGASLDHWLHRSLRRVVMGDVIVYRATRVAGPVAYRSAPGDWPVVVYTYDLLHASERP